MYLDITAVEGRTSVNVVYGGLATGINGPAGLSANGTD